MPLLGLPTKDGRTYGIAAFFPRAAVNVSGADKTFTRQSDSGYPVVFHFCPECGSNVYWEPRRKPDVFAVAAGAFADPTFPAPPKKYMWSIVITGCNVDQACIRCRGRAMSAPGHARACNGLTRPQPVSYNAMQNTFPVVPIPGILASFNGTTECKLATLALDVRQVAGVDGGKAIRSTEADMHHPSSSSSDY
jgi:hypothetical protein